MVVGIIVLEEVVGKGGAHNGDGWVPGISTFEGLVVGSDVLNIKK